MKYLSGLILVLLLTARISFGGNYAYIYIEGDKQTPFYVKVEGQMMPRLGKNYCILPNLAEGATNIEILFQQNAYPAQKFVVLVPEGGSRGFMLQKVNERQFALYDIQQGSYLVSGNKAADDHLPEATPQQQSPESAAPVAAAGDDGQPLPGFGSGRKEKKKKEPAAKQPQEGTQPDGRFIGDMELHPNPGAGAESLPGFRSKKNKAEREEGSLAAINEAEEPVPAPVAEKAPDAGMPNTDCSNPMSSEDFENFALKILDKTDDDGRIKVLSKNKGRQCFTTEQVRIIANNLDTQSGRYEVVKMLYAQTSDQDNYPALESLFKTNYLKGKFRELLTPKQ